MINSNADDNGTINIDEVKFISSYLIIIKYDGFDSRLNTRFKREV